MNGNRKVLTEDGVEQLPEPVAADATRQGAEEKITPSMRGWHSEFTTGLNESLQGR